MVVKRNLKNTGGSIPKIIYICNKTIKDIPESTVQRWKSLNPNYLVKLFGNIRNLLQPAAQQLGRV